MRTKTSSFTPLSWFVSTLAAVAVFGLCVTQADAGARLVAQASTGKRTVTKTVDDKGNTVVTIKQADRVRIKPVTVHIFRGSTVNGKKYGPPGQSVVVRQRGAFNSMIQYRANFTKEMRRSVKNL